jgi:murein DD-endopeptidase MepM/ murein hydrolase activator NlpD
MASRFPLDFVPRLSYKTSGRRFGAPRDGMKHPGCDLIAPVGTKVVAVDDGIVIKGPYHFFHGAYAIEVRHSLFVVRYCEIGQSGAAGTGTVVRAGQVIGKVVRMRKDSMLHFEMYSGTASGRLTVKKNPPFQRRRDLVDPTKWLDIWAAELAAAKAGAG